MQSNNPAWSSDTIMDLLIARNLSPFRQPLLNGLSIIRPLTDAEILGFGCDEGITALGLDPHYAPSRVVGVDIMHDPESFLPIASNGLGLSSFRCGSATLA
jgi:hypothetical protein